ncbi:hypothetical protein [Chitinophaga pinensis]|uniref:Lipoprotein n=1 Tax=Chitinophaga pinensis (strain ATCC 43595 / DSM 2588 / LMG 13176 / NBRC 15968 / NCIMB 11800 / UQM 2034) TaxID=485918 RepID=A0A979G720_CHIPD|nr:hypothetical protein [Chitinophaga pinensis]ACU61823.1 hypothetical protein Cpin_4376 [Chitinophaga pinensis DSM 2588]
MKKYYILISLCLLLSCKNKSESDFAKYLELKKMAVTSNIRKDTTFLQFRFGMSPTDLNNRIRELERDSTLYYDRVNEMYCYDIYTGRKNMDRVYCYFIPQFYNNELYSIVLQARQDNDNLANHSGIAISLMKLAIGDKYGLRSVSYKLTEGMEETFIWFQHNIEISIRYHVEGPIIEYKDLLREKLKEDQETKEEDQASSKTQKEL